MSEMSWMLNPPTVTASDTRFDFYQKAALDTASRGDHDTAAIYRDTADRYAR